MATRSIVTSQPDVECDVCERRLLRGEQPDVFLAAGRRQLVCELCAPRAVQEGWMRESGVEDERQPTARPRRRRGLLERLSVSFRARQEGPAASASADADTGYEQPQPAYEMFADDRDPALAGRWEDVGEGDPAEQPAAVEHEPDASEQDDQLRDALDGFNAGEHPRRVAGVARALGAPAVNVRHSEHARSVIAITIAWELCWYRYEVDLDESPPAARATGQGTELGELLREECVANAFAEESGTLRLGDPSLAGQPARGDLR